MALLSAGAELQKRGHRFTLFSLPDLAEVAAQYGVSFAALDNSRNYLPGQSVFLEAVGREKGMAYRDMVRFGTGEISLYCEQAPEAMQSAGIECLVADQVVIPASTVAERLKIPFVNICNSIPLCTDSDVPPYATLWPYHPGAWARMRNRTMYGILSIFSLPFSRLLNRYRRQFGLAPYRRIDDTFSRLAQITQLVSEFDFPFQTPRPGLCYVGPYRRESDETAAFPYDRLDGRPVIFATLGTLLGGIPGIWKTIAESCAGRDAQLVISLGGRGDPNEHRDLPGQPIVVSYAPQRELLKRVALMITHGGLNSVMETLSEGVPLVCLPAAYDQPGVAMRLAASGAGVVLPFSRCRTDRLQPLVRQVLGDPSYRRRAADLQKAIGQTRGIAEAAEIIERVARAGSMAS